jgi:sugar phosphate isomerase/epimerase
MRLGIFAKTFAGDDPLTVLRATRAAGFDVVQYNWACSGLGALPVEIFDGQVSAVASASAETGVGIAAVSATYNMIDPDPVKRAAGRASFAFIAARARAMGTRIITVCSGSADGADQWRHHPHNASPAAWADMCREFEQLLPIAEAHDLVIGVEPELANVVSSAAQARRLLDTFKSRHIGIVLDAANLFEVETPARQRAIIADAIAQLADAIIMAHAKDRHGDGRFARAGQGVIDWPHYIACLQAHGFDGDLVTHGLSAAEAPAVAAFLTARLKAVQP